MKKTIGQAVRATTSRLVRAATRPEHQALRARLDAQLKSIRSVDPDRYEIDSMPRRPPTEQSSSTPIPIDQES